MQFTCEDEKYGFTVKSYYIQRELMHLQGADLLSLIKLGGIKANIC